MEEPAAELVGLRFVAGGFATWVKGTTMSHILEEQTEHAVLLATDDKLGRNWWIFKGKFYWDDEQLLAKDVEVLVIGDQPQGEDRPQPTSFASRQPPTHRPPSQRSSRIHGSFEPQRSLGARISRRGGRSTPQERLVETGLRASESRWWSIRKPSWTSGGCASCFKREPQCLLKPECTRTLCVFHGINTKEFNHTINIPRAIQCLRLYDEINGTQYAQNAIDMYLIAAEALTNADGEPSTKRQAALANITTGVRRAES